MSYLLTSKIGYLTAQNIPCRLNSIIKCTYCWEFIIYMMLKTYMSIISHHVMREESHRSCSDRPCGTSPARSCRCRRSTQACGTSPLHGCVTRLGKVRRCVRPHGSAHRHANDHHCARHLGSDRHYVLRSASRHHAHVLQRAGLGLERLRAARQQASGGPYQPPGRVPQASPARRASQAPRSRRR